LADLRDKVRRGMLGQVHRGLSIGGRAYGYRSEPVTDEMGREVGRRRVVDPVEAEVVRRIFRLYRQGLTPRTIAHRLNKDQVPPPRTTRRLQGWTPNTISGSANKALGILHNPLYAGRFVWNRSRKVRDPDTGKRIMRVRPPAEWVWTEAPELRIVSPALWNDVQARIAQRRWTANPATHGARPKYLLSRLLVCGTCSGHYVVRVKKRDWQYYGYAARRERGTTICANDRLVRREVIEAKLLAHVFGDLFAPHRLAYLSRAVDAAIARAMEDPQTGLRRKGAELAVARAELAHIADAIRQGILTTTTRAMLEAAEQRVARLEAEVQQARRRPQTVKSLASSVERYLEDLRAAVGRNTDQARRLLARGLDQIILRQEGPHLVAEVRGNLAGLLRLEDTGFDSVGAGRGIFFLSEGPDSDWGGGLGFPYTSGGFSSHRSHASARPGGDDPANGHASHSARLNGIAE
jgi:site-specific DNA recombinase